MNAQQAKQIADHAPHKNWWVMHRINREAEFGCTDLDMKIDEDDALILQDLGYTVIPKYNGIYTVDWSNPK
jgi:hypothetical protein